MVYRKPFASRTLLRRQTSRGGRKVGIGCGFLWTAIDLYRGSVAAWQFERIDELPALACSIAQMMRLVDDDEIELALGQALGVFTPARGRDRGNDAVLRPECFRFIAQARIICRREGKTELGLQFLAPLPD